jgi:hypothetical protein
MRTSYKLLSFVSVSVILLSNVCLILRMRNFYAKSSLSESYSQRLSSYVSTANDLLENDGLELSDVYLVDLSNNMFRPLKSLFLTGTDRIFVCRVSQYYCESCVNYAIEKIVSVMSDSLIDMPVAVFGMYENNLSLKIISEQHNNSNGVEYYKTSALNLPMERHGYPYCFVIDRSLRVSDVYTLDKIDSVRNDNYFRIISKKWKSDK